MSRTRSSDVQARHFEWPAGRQTGKTRELRDADGQRQVGKTICLVVSVVGLFLLLGEGVSAKCRE